MRRFLRRARCAASALATLRATGLVCVGFGLLAAGWLDEHGFPRDDVKRHYLLDDDVELNCQGVEVWLDRK